MSIFREKESKLRIDNYNHSYLCSSPIFTQKMAGRKTSKTHRLWILKIPPGPSRSTWPFHSLGLYICKFSPTISKNFPQIARILNVALPHDESLSRDPSGTLAWYDWRSAFFPKDRNHRAQVALWTLINTPFYGRVNVSRRSVQLMLPHSYSRSLCPKNIPRESSRKCNSPRRDFRRITDRSFSSLEIACGMVVIVVAILRLHDRFIPFFPVFMENTWTWPLAENENPPSDPAGTETRNTAYWQCHYTMTQSAAPLAWPLLVRDNERIQW